LHLQQVFVRLVGRDEDPRFEHLMHRHHYLGAFLGANENAPGFANQKYPAKIAVNRLYRS